MEAKKISELLPKVSNDLPNLPQLHSQDTDNEISLYKDSLPGPSDIASGVAKLKSCFPEIDSDFSAVLIDRIVANGFTKQRLQDAISHVIDTCKYPRPSIAEIISFDKKVKTYSYQEMIANCNIYKSTDECFEMVIVNGKKRWIEK